MKVLMVEDNRGDARLIKEMLSEVATGQFELLHAESLEAALKCLGETIVDVVLLDLSLPDSHGLDTFVKIRDQSPATPVVVLSGFADEAFALEAVRHGAQDYLAKGQTNSGLLVRALRYAIERQGVEEALRGKEEKFRNLLESLPEIVIEIDGQGNISYANEIAFQTFGYTHEEFNAGLNAVQMVAPEDGDKILAEMHRAMSGELPRIIEATALRKDGSRFPITIHGSHVIDDEGNIIGIRAIVANITERKRMEQEIREKEEKLRFMFQSMGDMIVAMDLKGDVVDVNESTVRTLGYKNEGELIGRSSAELVVEAYRDDAVKMAVEAIKKGLHADGPEYQYLHLRTASGGDLEVEYGINLIRDAAGSVMGVLGIARDITERKRQEQALRESEGKLRTMFESVGEAIIVTDSAGNILEVNDVAPELSGYSKQELVGRNAISLIAPRDHDMIIQQMRKNLEDKSGLKQFQCSFVRADGTEIEAEFSSSPLMNESGDVSEFVTIARDVTKRRQAEEVVRQRNRELIAMNTISQSLSQQSRLDDLLQSALDSTLEVMDLPAGGIWLIDEESQKLTLTVHKGVCERVATAAREIPLGAGVTGEATKTGKVTMSTNMLDDVRIPHALKSVYRLGDLRALVSVPLRSKGKTLGVMNIFDREPRDFTEKDIRLLETIGGQIGVAIENAQLMEKLSELSITDKLTGSYNRRHFYEVLESEMNRSRRYRHTFCLVMVDLDGFKLYNDIYGHISGDEVLKDFARTLKSMLRKTDPVFRYGGDEFAIIFPSTNVERAEKIIERVRAQWPSTSKDISFTLETPLGFSAGIAQFPEDIDTIDGLIFMADAALMKAKRGGKYRTELASRLEQHESEPQHDIAGFSD